MVLVIGLEPIRCCHRGILSPLRLPISPYQHIIRKELKTKKGLKKSLLNALKGAGMQFGGATRI